MSEYIYKNQNDTIRVKIFQRETGQWDFDVFKRDGDFYTFSCEEADNFNTKRDAKIEMEYTFGKMKSTNPKDTVTNGW